MGRPVEADGVIGGFKVDLAHQEMDRLLTELEQWYQTVNEQGAEWLSAEVSMAAWLHGPMRATWRATGGLSLSRMLQLEGGLKTTGMLRAGWHARVARTTPRQATCREGAH
jgi:hypothetical protein